MATGPGHPARRLPLLSLYPDRHYILKEQEGMLIAPFVRHSYEKTTDEWYTLFATFTGTVENALPQMLGNRRFILTGSD